MQLTSMKLSLWSIVSMKWPRECLFEQLARLQLDQCTSSKGCHFDDFIGFIGSLHSAKIFSFLMKMYQVVEAAAMRSCSHMAFWRPFYKQKCLQLYRSDAFWELKSDLSLRFARFLGRSELKPFILNGLEASSPRMFTLVWGETTGNLVCGNH